MENPEIIKDLKNSLLELMNLVEKQAKFSLSEFGDLIHCLDCLDKKIINQIRNNGLLSIE